MECTMEILYGACVFLFFYTIFCSIVSIVSLWKIFEKEGIPSYYSLIPFLNIYKYFQICKLPFWTIFVPLVNVVTLYCSSFVITRKYRLKKWQSILAILFPFVFLPYIAFSDKKNIDNVYSNLYLRNSDDLEKLEKSLESNNNYEINDTIPKTSFSNEQNISDIIIDSVESSIMFDEFVYDDVKEIVEQDDVHIDNNVSNDVFYELDDEVEIDNLSLENVDQFEDNIKKESSVDKSIQADIKEYQEQSASQEAIAFGGEKRIENIVSVQSKNDDLTCPRCGSSLVGANGFCPGCGIKM